MECLERQELQRINIESPDGEIRRKIKSNWDAIAKPLDGMGKFESMTAQIGAILEDEIIDISKKAVIIMCADNGIVAEGISQSGQEVTRLVAENMGKGQSSVGRMAAFVSADTIPVDIGINDSLPIPGVLNRKVRQGTRNFKMEPAMTEVEAVKAICVGIESVRECKEKGYRLLATGEMGIGNTTTSSAVAASLLGCNVDEVTGRGAGLNDEGLLRKRQVIREAIDKYNLYEADAFRVLQTVGGLDIAGLTGVCIGGAIYHVPIVLDGVISMVAALVAEKIVPGTKEYLIPSHIGKEPAMINISKALNMEPVIAGNLALGEGTGAVMVFPLLDMALEVYRESSSFSEIKVEQYERYESV